MLSDISVRGETAIELTSNLYDSNTGDDLYHIVRESPVSYILTYIVPKSSPFISEFKRAIIDASEFGFVRLVTLKTNADIERKQAMRLIRKHGREAQVISLGHLENIFNFYKICIAVCCFTFIAEICRHWVRQHLRTFQFLYFLMSNF